MCRVCSHAPRQQLDREDREMLFRAMFQCKYRADDIIIREGDQVGFFVGFIGPSLTRAGQGDNFYIVTEGECEAYVSKNPSVPVFHYEPGSSFGELALIHCTPRMATVV